MEKEKRGSLVRYIQETSAKKGREITGVKRQSKSEHETTDAKKSVEDRGKRCPTPEVQKKSTGDVLHASVAGDLSSGKVSRNTQYRLPTKCNKMYIKR